MADCLAGMWAAGAQKTTDAQGEPIITELTQDDIKRAIDAAQAVGDDRIQKRTSGRVDTDSFTHGSAAQRVRWFNRGMEDGTIKACDTFATDNCTARPLARGGWSAAYAGSECQPEA